MADRFRRSLHLPLQVLEGPFVETWEGQSGLGECGIEYFEPEQAHLHIRGGGGKNCHNILSINIPALTKKNAVTTSKEPGKFSKDRLKDHLANQHSMSVSHSAGMTREIGVVMYTEMKVWTWKRVTIWRAKAEGAVWR